MTMTIFRSWNSLACSGFPNDPDLPNVSGICNLKQGSDSTPDGLFYSRSLRPSHSESICLQLLGTSKFCPPMAGHGHASLRGLVSGHSWEVYWQHSASLWALPLYPTIIAMLVLVGSGCSLSRLACTLSSGTSGFPLQSLSLQ